MALPCRVGHVFALLIGLAVLGIACSDDAADTSTPVAAAIEPTSDATATSGPIG